jgi:hypothetical protein
MAEAAATRKHLQASKGIAACVQRCCADASSLLNFSPRCSVLWPKRSPRRAPTSSTPRSQPPPLPHNFGFCRCHSLLPPPPSPLLPPPSPLPPAPSYPYRVYSNSSLLLFPIKLLGFANSNPVQRGANMKCATGQRGRSSSRRTPSCDTRHTTTLCTPRLNQTHRNSVLLKRFFLSYTDMRMAGDKQTLVLLFAP